MSEREYKTRRGALLADLEWGKVGPGEYLVEGYTVTCVRKAAGLYAGRWTVRRTFHLGGGLSRTDRHTATNFTDALEWIATEIERRKPS